MTSGARLDGFKDAVAGKLQRITQHFDQVIDVNVSGGMRVSAAARPLLARSKGSIVFIASVMSYFGGPKQPAYSTSKGAVRNLTMSLACAYATRRSCARSRPSVPASCFWSSASF